MDTLTISEAATATGFTPSALRFYEAAGLIAPGRSDAGYRLYDDADLTTLRFIGRAKGLGLSLEDIAELVPLLDAGRCGPVQEQLRAFVLDKVDETRQRSAEILGFLAQLESVAARLGTHTPEGRCDDRCGCTSDGAEADGWVAARLAGAADPAGRAGGAVPVACTLAPDQRGGRVEDWRRATAAAVHREPLADGARVDLPRTTDLAALARLVAAEQTCCTFFTFALTVTGEAVRLDVTAPPEGVALARELVGASLGAVA